ncbi:MAG: hypothetical protein RQ885_14060 [Desulfurococcales archaeon]|nr:hypothetical protein [Desulfurococcales archaeon]
MGRGISRMYGGGIPEACLHRPRPPPSIQKRDREEEQVENQ